jgi:hypothetical protein
MVLVVVMMVRIWEEGKAEECSIDSNSEVVRIACNFSG